MPSKSGKIYINKNEETLSIIRKVLEAPVQRVVLNISRFSEFAQTVDNFILLKREAGQAGKEILIESVDDEALELAKIAGLKAINPFFQRERRVVSDIIGGFDKEIKRPERASVHPVRDLARAENASPKDLGEATSNGVHHVRHRARKPFKFKLPPLSFPAIPRFSFSIPGFKKFGPAVGLSAFVLFSGAVYVGAFVLPRVEIEAALVKKNIELNESVIADKNISAVNEKNLAVPAVIFTQKGTLQLTFPASGKKAVSNKAKGKMTIYNAFSSVPQTLVATTRFLTPDNKLFRLEKAVTIPGAKIVDGKITPSSIIADAVADQPGEAYNVGPVNHFTIPGFKGTPRYEGFYAESKEAMTGGFIGEVAVPSAQDLKSGRESISRSLQDSLKQKTLLQWPAGLKLIEGATEFKILREETQEKVAEESKFGIVAEAEFKALAFKEEEVKKIFVNKALSQLQGDYEVLEFALTYNLGRSDFSKGTMSFPAKATVFLRRAVNVDELRNRLAGKSEADLKTIIFSLPGLENAKISFWPFWVSWSPNDVDKIKIRVL